MTKWNYIIHIGLNSYGIVFWQECKYKMAKEGPLYPQKTPVITPLYFKMVMYAIG